jgi:hypothetical protein
MSTKRRGGRDFPRHPGYRGLRSDHKINGVATISIKPRVQQARPRNPAAGIPRHAPNIGSITSFTSIFFKERPGRTVALDGGASLLQGLLHRGISGPLVQSSAGGLYNTGEVREKTLIIFSRSTSQKRKPQGKTMPGHSPRSCIPDADYLLTTDSIPAGG